MTGSHMLRAGAARAARAAALALLVAACEAGHADAGGERDGGAGEPAIDGGERAGDAAGDDAGSDAASAIDAALSGPRYGSLIELHELAIAPTCALNGGVCHNASSYPDLRTPSALVASVGQPCGLSAVGYGAFPDACEGPGDRFVVAGAGFDAEVVDVVVTEVDWAIDLPVAVELWFDAPVPAIPPDARGFEVRRGSRSFPLEPASAVAIESISERRLVLRVALADGKAIARFLDVRGLPYPIDAAIRWADANGNGLHASAAPAHAIVPGRPLDSWVVRRLIDPSLGELMPRQCRTWSDDATRALACWIEGLAVDDAGAVTNAYEPIDYERCTVALPPGRCAGVLGSGPAAVDAIVARSCGGSGCHIGEDAPAAGLDLSSGRARVALRGRSSERAGRMIVVPGDPDGSYLLCKLEAACAAREGTTRMPLGSALTPDELAIVREWIASGAE